MAPLQSTIDQIPRSNSLVSSVGFHNLSKQTSNTSSIKSQSSRTTLSRLFSRDHSQLQPSTKHRKNSSQISETSNANHRSQFFLSRGFLKSKTSSQDGNLHLSRNSIISQSAGVHDSYLEEEELDYSQNDSSSNKFSNGSVFKQQANPSSRLEKSTISGIKSTAQKNMRQNGISLSSQNSNSLIINAKAASSLYFTQTDLSEEVIKPNVDSGRLQDFHRKYLAPAEQFMQVRLQKLFIDGDIGTIHVKDEGSGSDTPSKSTDIEVIFTKILEVSPFILHVTTDGFSDLEHMHMVLDSRAEKLIHLLEDELMTYIMKEKRETWHHEAHKKLDSKMSSFMHTREYTHEYHESIEANLENFIKKLESFCTQVVMNLAADLNLITDHLVYVQSRQRSLSNLDTLGTMDINKHLTSWTQIIKAWKIFNTKIRYTLLNCLFYVQKDLTQVQEQHPKYRDNPKFQLDKLLNSIFKLQFVVPQLKQRQREFEKQKKGQPHAVFDLLEMERTMLLKDEGRILKSLQSIFGIIATRTRILYNSPDDTSLNDLLFNDFYAGLFALTRPSH